MQRRTLIAILSIGSLVGLFSCDHGARVAESPDQPMTPASRFETRGGPPEQRGGELNRGSDVEAAPPTPTPAAPRSELDTEIDSSSDTNTDTDDVPEPPSSELPPSSGPNRQLNWIDDTGNSIP